MSAEDTTLIQDYLYNRLPADSRKAFEARVAQEPALAEELALERAIHLAGVEFLMADVEQSIGEIRTEKAQPTQSTLRVIFARPATRWMIGLAASLALILTFWFLQQKPDTLSPQELALKYLPHLEGQTSFRSADPIEAPSDSVVLAFNLAFNQRKLAQCKALLPRFALKNAQDSLDTRIKWAWIDLMEGKTTAAETQFAVLQSAKNTAELPLAIRENLDYGLFLSQFLQGKTDKVLQDRLHNSLVYGEHMRKLANEKRLDLKKK
ncbi:MAG: hypothetical protein SFV55_26675 [Haliscomenobacter sp.]|uniref:hypothetical protein n=1 Tax=Haliscomenobacter sp. TaxID=2717303 RepID=UPI00299FC776|nr:hypothetical protein [Haliscomenobacter sp.]MDX2072047.1 hypothetical protein [Haliscomenobacter sp.]